jgi:hypothetical protein
MILPRSGRCALSADGPRLILCVVDFHCPKTDFAKDAPRTSAPIVPHGQRVVRRNSLEISQNRPEIVWRKWPRLVPRCGKVFQ